MFVFSAGEKLKETEKKTRRTERKKKKKVSLYVSYFVVLQFFVCSFFARAYTYTAIYVYISETLYKSFLYQLFDLRRFNLIPPNSDVRGHEITL
jgi:hypothetical protein